MPMLDERDRAALRQADDELSDLQVALAGFIVNGLSWLDEPRLIYWRIPPANEI